MLHGGEIYDKNLIIEKDLSVNLNPYPAPNTIKEALERAVADVDKYPDIHQTEFRHKVAEAENHISKKDYISYENVIGGNGASELFLSVINYLKPSKVLLPVPCFYGYFHALSFMRDIGMRDMSMGDKNINDINMRNIKKHDVEIIQYLLEEKNEFSITSDILDMITEDIDLLILANPNNPTGKCIEDSLLKRIVEKCKAVDTALIIDECFLNLSTKGKSAVSYISYFPKLFIINAYTKLFSIPGVRVGYCISSKENIHHLYNYLPEWNMSIFAQYAGIACAEALINTDFLQKSKELIIKRREALMQELTEKGIKAFSSDTCFLLVHSDKDLYEEYLRNNILIRDCSNFEGLRKGFYRLSVR